MDPPLRIHSVNCNNLLCERGTTVDKVLFPMIPQACDIDRLKKEGEHWQWFRAPNAFPGHTTNAYETADGKTEFDLPMTDKNAFFWWLDTEGNAPDPKEIRAGYVRRRTSISRNPKSSSGTTTWNSRASMTECR
ncbi:hypothetical protein F5B19DRAFT_492147 [Rostrohypoxylon terebratum]|nr:hypothetical protein F5B19DRAFT_492147 [Rostrohypoxylon terebratum]